MITHVDYRNLVRSQGMFFYDADTGTLRALAGADMQGHAEFASLLRGNGFRRAEGPYWTMKIDEGCTGATASTIPISPFMVLDLGKIFSEEGIDALLAGRPRFWNGLLLLRIRETGHALLFSQDAEPRELCAAYTSDYHDYLVSEFHPAE